MTEISDIQPLLKHLAGGDVFTRDQARQAFQIVMSGQATPAQIGSLLTALAVRSGGPTVDEITGAAEAMRAHVRRVRVPENATVVDTCGTGGDHTSTFNISTAAAIIAAAAGAHVAKHGNRSVTSTSGSSQVLEVLGVKLDVSDENLYRCLLRARICFCYAVNHHPAMKHAVGPRRELGFRTIFNILGPLTNPAGATRQIIGVFDPELIEPIAQVLANLGSQRAMVVYGQAAGGGLDELTTTGPTRIANLEGGRVTTTTLDPENVGLTRVHIDALQVASVEESAAMIQSVLSGEKGPPRDIAALNAAAALLVAGLADDLQTGLEKAFEALDTGAAQATLIKLIQFSNAE